MQECTLKLLVNNDLYDDLSDHLLAYQTQQNSEMSPLPLHFWGYPVQSHSQKLTDIKEQVSGFKSQMLIEIETHADEAQCIHQYLGDCFGKAHYQASLHYSTKLA